MKTKYWITELIIFLLTALFCYTALYKLRDYNQFIWQVNNQPFDNRITSILAPALPAAELALIILLLWPRTRMIGLIGATVLLTMFTIYTALVTFHFYDRVPCVCATAFEHFSWPAHLLSNVIFLALAVTGIYYLKQKEN